jgi:hypothetical protein
VKQQDLRDAQSKADMQLVEQRTYLDRKEREHHREVDRLQVEIERHLREHSDLIGKIIKHLLLCFRNSPIGKNLIK